MGSQTHQTYIDGIPFKISEKYQPPKPVTIPRTYTSPTLQAVLANAQYDFTKEQEVLEWTEAQRRASLAYAAAQEEAKRRREEAEALNSGEEGSSGEDEEASSAAGPSDDSETTEQPQPESPGGTLLVSRQNSIFARLGKDILTPTPIAAASNPANHNPEPGQTTASKPNAINISDFESVQDPFETLTLQTIDDRAELAELLQPGGVFPSSSGANDGSIVTDVRANGIEREDPAISSPRAAPEASTANPTPELPARSQAPVPQPKPPVSAPGPQVITTPSSAPQKRGPRRPPSYQNPVYDEVIVNLKHRSSPAVVPSTEHSSPLPPLVPLSTSEARPVPPPVATRSSSNSVFVPPSSSNAVFIPSSASSSSASSFPPELATHQYVTSRMAPPPIPAVRQSKPTVVAPTPVSTTDLLSPSSSEGLSFRDDHFRGGAVEGSCTVSTVGVKDGPSGSNGFAFASWKREGPPPKPKPKPTVAPKPATSSSSTTNQPAQASASGTSATLKRLPDPFDTLDPEGKDTVRELAMMGFPRARIARVVKQLGSSDQQAIIDYLLKVDALCEKGIPGELVEQAFKDFPEDDEQAEKFAEVTHQLSEFGFDQTKIFTAVKENDNDRERALEALMAG